MSVLFQHLTGDHIEWDRFQSGKQAPMSYNPAKGFPRIMPSLWYEDVGEALDVAQPRRGLQRASEVNRRAWHRSSCGNASG